MPNKDAIRVHEIRIENILGIAEMEIRPGQVTVIDGKNGSGKTSILSAIRAALGGGHDGTLLRKGSDVGEVVLLLDDGKRIEKRITRDGSKSAISDPVHGKVSKPQTFMDSLIDKFSLNPIDFLAARTDKRVELLLESIPMKLSEMDVIEALDLCAVKHELSGHALKVIQVIAKDLYDQRTGVNRLLKDKLSTIDEMTKVLPSEASREMDYSGEVETAQAAYLELQKGILECRAAIGKECAEQQRASESEYSDVVRALEQERDSRIEEIRKDCETKISNVRATSKDSLRILQQNKDASLAELQTEVDSKEQPLKDRLAEARAKLETHARATSARKHMETLRSDAGSLQNSSDDLSAAINQLDELKVALLERLPIKGLELLDGDIFLDGVPFDRVNEARKVQVAIEIAQLRCGRLPLIVVDGLERLDSATFQAFIDEVKKRDIQLIATRVTEGELAVRAV